MIRPEQLTGRYIACSIDTKYLIWDTATEEPYSDTRYDTRETAQTKADVLNAVESRTQ